MSRIERRAAQYAGSPFFAFLRDPSIDPRQKLGFAPHVTHYVLTFADLCALILPEEPARDPYQQIVNANADEDAGHWQWFLSDLATLGRDPELRFSDAMRLVWSDATVRTRKLSYHLCHYALGADSVGKLVLVHCFEAAFKITIAPIGRAAAELTALTGTPLRFLGGSHVEAEDAHTLDQADAQEQIRAIELTAEARRPLEIMVDGCFDMFTAFASEMHDLAAHAPPERASGSAAAPRLPHSSGH